MAQRTDESEKADGRKPCKLAKRITVRVPKDVQQLVTASFTWVPWESWAHLVSASMRWSLIKFAPTVARVDRLEKLAFEKKLKPPNKQKRECPKQLTVTLDPDAQQLGDVSMARSAWLSANHLVVACLRRSLLPFATPEIEVTYEPFEQCALAKPMRMKRIKPRQ